MRPLFLAALNCFIGNEPSVPATPQIIPASMRPPRDIALVLIWHTQGQPIQFDGTRIREMKNIFVAVIEKPRRIDRFEMPECFEATFDPHPALRVRVGSRLGGALRGLR